MKRFAIIFFVSLFSVLFPELSFGQNEIKHETKRTSSNAGKNNSGTGSNNSSISRVKPGGSGISSESRNSEHTLYNTGVERIADMSNMESIDPYLESGWNNGYAYVDLGLPSGTKWATTNIGSSSKDGYGDYFAWGELSQKQNYAYNCKTTGSSFGPIAGDSSYDPARFLWGNSWRLPTKDECEELRANCNWTWIDFNGTAGYRVEGPNGRSIFLPAAGWYDNTTLMDVRAEGDYWSASPYEAGTDRAYYLMFNNVGRGVGHGTRGCGLTVRPVFR